MKILAAAQMGEVDRLTTDTYKIPSLLLMESAGRSFVDELEKACPDLLRKRVVVFCGKGNNGGDGLVVARYIALRGGRPEVWFFGDPANMKGDPLVNWQIVRALSVPVRIVDSEQSFREGPAGLRPPQVIVDGLFGTGLAKPIGADLSYAVNWINDHADEAFVAAVDIPSGLFADSPEIPGPAVKAHLTVTFSALKLAHVLSPAADHAGKVVVVPIGSPAELFENPEYRMSLIDAELVRRVLPGRARDGHKGTYGHVYVLGGSRGKSGAALMTGMAALRSGAGLVTLWMPEGLQHDVTGKFPELMTEYLPETPEGSADFSGAGRLLAALRQVDALVVGPGMTTNPETQRMIREIVRQSPVPVVLDADGLNAFAAEGAGISNDAGSPVVVTPHPGEMARLIGAGIGDVQKDRIRTAREFSAAHGCYVVLKGSRSVVCSPGGNIYINSSGNPGMATAGSGDILSGIAGRFVAGWARGKSKAGSPDLAEHVAAAVYLHGLAGDFAATELGEESMTATDILPHLPAAFKACAARRRS